MAKKASNKVDIKKRKMAKVILSVKSPKTGAYTFKEVVVPQEEALKVVAQKIGVV